MYKVGDEVWVKGKVMDVDEESMHPYEVLITNSRHGECDWIKEIGISDKTYEQGLNDAWELAKKIVMGVEDGGFDSQEVIDVFGKNRYYSFKDLTAEEAYNYYCNN